MSKDKITIGAVIAASSEKVWQYWTEPDHITQWGFTSDDWCCPSVEKNLTVGGHYKARMEYSNGSVGFDFEAIYDDVVALKTLSYTITDGRRVTTSFTPMGSSTKVTTLFDSETDNSIYIQRDGWQATLNNFKRHVERAAGNGR